MRIASYLAWLILLACASIETAGAQEPARCVGPGPGVAPCATEELGCGELILNSDGTYENGYGWGFGGQVPPYYGAFAECYFGQREVCSLVFDFTTTDAAPPSQPMDVYIWADGGGIPAGVLYLDSGVDPGTIAMWPDVSRHVIELAPPPCTGDSWWCGYWGDWVGFGDPCWYVAADENGPGGCPFTNIAPGIGLPTGWHHVSVVSPWRRARALGIGAEVREGPSPVECSDWGRIKALFGGR